MNLNEIVNKASNMEIDLGKNPARTIRFYMSKGLLESPNIIYKGKIKQADYSVNHLTRLQLINIYKKKGFTLDKIKNIMNGSIYLSNKGLEFIKTLRKKYDIPNNAFQKGKPITKRESAYILYNYVEMKKYNKNLSYSINDFVKEVFIDDNGEQLSEFEQI